MEVSLELSDNSTANDYYPFGMIIPGRKYSAANGYRYGFNGKENDKDIAAGDLDFGARIYDVRTGRFLSTDPLAFSYSFLSSYCFAANNPILQIDVNGEGPDKPLDATLETRLIVKLRAISFVDVLKRSNNFSLRALEKWGWNSTPTLQQENKVRGLAGEATTVADMRSSMFNSFIFYGKKKQWNPLTIPLTESLIKINASGDGDEDKTIDIYVSAKTGKIGNSQDKFGLTLPFVDTEGKVINNGKGETYVERPIGLAIEVKTGTSLSNMIKGISQATRQKAELDKVNGSTVTNVAVVAYDRAAYIEALKNSSFKQAVDAFIKAGGKVLNIDHLNDRSEALKNEVREEIRRGTNKDAEIPSQINRPKG